VWAEANKKPRCWTEARLNGEILHVLKKQMFARFYLTVNTRAT
jgi:hypothetical protein